MDSHSSGTTSPQTSSDLPEPNAGHINGFLFDLAPSGVCPALAVTNQAVCSYHTISPLPKEKNSLWRYLFCGTFRKLTFPRNYLALCPMEPGLSSHVKKRARLSGPLPIIRILNWVTPSKGYAKC